MNDIDLQKIINETSAREISDNLKRKIAKNSNVILQLQKLGYDLKNNTESAIDLRENYSKGLISKDEVIDKYNNIAEYLTRYLDLVDVNKLESSELEKIVDEKVLNTQIALGVMKHDLRILSQIAMSVYEKIEPDGSNKNFVEQVTELAVSDPSNFLVYEILRKGQILMSYLATGDNNLSIETKTNMVEPLIKSYDSKLIFNLEFGNIPEIRSEEFYSIWQLAKNSKRFQKKKSPINISFKKSNSDIIISVSDNGCGISETDLPLIFGTYTNGSTGLGLQIVNRIAEIREGHIEVSSKIRNDKPLFYSTKKGIVEEGFRTKPGTELTLYLPKIMK